MRKMNLFTLAGRLHLERREPAVREVDALRVAPFIKWVGGKGKLFSALQPLLPTGVEKLRHVEPFMGGGAMFFAQAPRRALLSDVNPDLVLTYTAVREDVSTVIQHLSWLAVEHDEDNYYAARDRYNARLEKSDAERAALFIYLNKTCFNGLHRVNKSGDFNVPMGRYVNPRILDREGLLAASARLFGVEIKHQSFEGLLDDARPDDFVYLDPPYEPVSNTSNFTAYAAESFGQAQQIKLRDVYLELHNRGCRLMLSNSDVPFIRELYGRFRIDSVLAPRSVSCGKRTAVQEVVVRNYR